MKAGDIVYEVEIETAKLTRGEREAAASLDNLEGKMGRTERSSNKLGTSMTKLAQAIGGVIAATALANEFKKAIAVTRDFNATISDLSALTGSTGEQLTFLREAALEFGRTTTLSASQAATALKLVAGAKPDLLSSADALKAVTREAISLAEAAGIDLPEAAAALTTTLNQFQLGAEESSRVINVLAAGAKEGAAEISATVAVLGEAGVVAAQSGLSIEALTGATQALAKGAITGTRAGTGLRNILTILNTNVDKDLRPSVVGLNQALDNLAKKGLDDTQMVKLFGRETLTAASTLLQFRDEAKRVEEAVTGTNEAYRQAAERTDNLLGDTKSLGSAYEALQLEIGSLSDNTLRDLVQMLTKVTQSVASNRDVLETAFTVVGVAAQSAAAIIAGRVVMAMLLYTKSVYDNVKSQVLAATTTTAAGAAAGGTVAPLTAARIAMNSATVAATGLRTAFAFLGGPAGVLFLVGTAIYQYTQRAKEAKPTTDRLKDSLHQMSTAGERSAKMFAGLARNVDNLNKQEIDIRTQKVEENLKRAEQNLKRYTRMFESGHKTITSGLIEQQESHIIELNRQLENLRARQSRSGAGPAATETDEGQKAIASLRDQIELAKLSGEAKARLQTIQRLGADATAEEREEAERLTVELYRLERAQEAATEQTKKSADALADQARAGIENEKVIQALQERISQASMNAKELAERQAELTLNEYATPEQIERVRQLAGQMHEAEAAAERMARANDLLNQYDEKAAAEDTHEQKIADLNELIAMQKISEDEYREYTLQAETDLKEQLMQLDEERFAAQSLGNQLLIDSLNSVKDHATDAFIEFARGANDGTDAAKALAQAIGQSVLKAIVDMGVQMAVNAVKEKLFAAQSVSTAAASGAAITAAYTPAAAAASVATLGGAAVAGLSSMAAAVPAMMAMFTRGGRMYGGQVGAGGMYRVNENGPEIFNAANGSQYMMPNQRGEVVSNSDARGAIGSGGGVTINVHESPKATARIEQSQGPDGETIINFMIEDLQNNGPYIQQLSGTHGIERQGI